MAGNGEQHKMNPKVKKLWVKALRSGRYKQGRHKLRQKQDGEVLHCCLGVLEEVRIAQTGATRFQTGRGDNCNLLSDTTREWAGLDEADPVLMPKQGLTAAELNDTGRTFRFIADRIERYL